MNQDEFNKIVDDATDNLHKETVIQMILGKVYNLEREVGYLRGGTAWNDVAQKMLTFEARLKAVEDGISNDRCDDRELVVGDYAWGIDLLGDEGCRIAHGTIISKDNSSIPYLVNGWWCSFAFKTKEECLDKLREIL